MAWQQFGRVNPVSLKKKFKFYAAGALQALLKINLYIFNLL